MNNYPIRVMCITTEDFTGEGFPDTSIRVGDEFIAVGEQVGYGRRGATVDCYVLATDGKWLYDKRNFATLPEASADEMNEQEREAIVPNPMREVMQAILITVIFLAIACTKSTPISEPAPADKSLQDSVRKAQGWGSNQKL